jgi:hypothetical protein
MIKQAESEKYADINMMKKIDMKKKAMLSLRFQKCLKNIILLLSMWQNCM